MGIDRPINKVDLGRCDVAKKTCSLVKVWFDELHYMEGNHFTGTKGMSPGGAIFEEGFYYEADLREKSLVLHHSCKVVEKKDLVELQFEDGSVSCLCRDKVRRIEKVSREVDVLPIYRKDLLVFWCRIPDKTYPVNTYQRMKAFVQNADNIVLSHLAFGSSIIESVKGKKDKETPCLGYHVLVKTKNREEFIKLFFAEKLTPPGRMWMVLQHHPTHAEVRRMHPSI